MLLGVRPWRQPGGSHAIQLHAMIPCSSEPLPAQGPIDPDRTLEIPVFVTGNQTNSPQGFKLCLGLENAALAAQRKVGAEAGFCFGISDRRTVQARIASISDCEPSWVIPSWLPKRSAQAISQTAHGHIGCRTLACSSPTSKVSRLYSLPGPPHNGRRVEPSIRLPRGCVGLLHHEGGGRS